MKKYEEELRSAIKELSKRMDENFIQVSCSSKDIVTNEEYSGEDKNRKIRELLDSISLVKKINELWYLDENSHLINEKVDEFVEKELIKYELLDQDGYLLSFSKEKNEKAKKLEKEKNRKKKFRIFAAGVLCASSLTIGVLGANITKGLKETNKGKKIIYEKIDEEKGDFYTYTNSNSEKKIYYKGEYYEYNIDDGVNLFISDMLDKGFNKEEIASYLMQTDLDKGYVLERTNTTKKKVKNERKSEYYETQTKKLTLNNN